MPQNAATSFRGVYPIVNTTFHDDGSIDIESQRRLVRFLLDAGAHGLGLFGNASEGYTLSGEERRQILAMIVREVDGRVPVIVSSGHTGTDLAVALSREAQDCGADGLMVLPPHFMKPDADGVFHYFRAISEAVKIPVMVQDAPLMSGVTIGAPLIARMARELEQVRYVKVEAPPTAPKISAILDGNDAPPVLFGGLNGQFLIEELDRGAVGTMPGSDLTAAFVSMWNLWEAGDRAGARREFARYLPLIRYELQPGLGVSVMKHNLVAAGVIGSARVRHPTRSLDPAGLREIAELRAELPLTELGWA